MTSSSGLMPKATSARCKPAVPELTPMPCRRPTRSATSRSNSSSRGPMESRPLRIVSTTLRISASVISGWLRGMRSAEFGRDLVQPIYGSAKIMARVCTSCPACLRYNHPACAYRTADTRPPDAMTPRSCSSLLLKRSACLAMRISAMESARP